MVKNLIWLIPLVGISFISSLSGYQPSPYQNNSNDLVSQLQRTVKNQEIEIKAFEQQLENLHTIIESVRDQVQEGQTAQKERLKGNAESIEMKIASLESTAKGLAADLKQLQTHANETTAALQAFKQKLGELDQRGALQSKNIENMQAALQSVLDAFQLKPEGSGSALSNWTGRTYKVQNGDTLEKIAKMQQTTVQAIKEANGITNDKIVVGKTLKIPG